MRYVSKVKLIILCGLGREVYPDYLLQKVPSLGVKKSLSSPQNTASSTSGKKDFFPDHSKMSLHGLAESFKGWYIHSSKQIGFQDVKLLLQGRLEEIQQCKIEDLTLDVWNLAVCFYHLSIMWKRRFLIHDIGECKVNDLIHYFLDSNEPFCTSNPNGSLSTFWERA
jgi:hypothetical protein